MKKLILSFLFFTVYASSIFASPWGELLLLPIDLSDRWTISSEQSNEKPGFFAIESRKVEKLNGYIGWTFLYPQSYGVAPEEEVRQRMDRFLAAQPSDLKAVRTVWKYGNSPGEQLIYLLKDPEKGEILAWFAIVHWAHGDRLYSLTLCSLTETPLEELDFFLTSQLGPQTIVEEIFLP